MTSVSAKLGGGWVKAVAALLIVGGAAWLIWDSYQRGDSLLVKTQEVSPAELPSLFPEGFPLENGATVLQNYEATTPDGRQQATRAFVSNRTLEANAQTYRDYLEVDHWVVQAEKNDATYRAIMAEKEGVSVQVVMTEASGERVVQITFMSARTSTRQ
jgi:hypothetical protein